MSNTYLGLKLSTLFAGLLGGIISLAFLQRLSLPGKVVAVFGGAVSAGYLSPPIMFYVSTKVGDMPSLEMENTIAFLVGLTGMNLLAGVYKLSLVLKDRPQDIWAFLKKR